VVNLKITGFESRRTHQEELRSNDKSNINEDSSDRGKLRKISRDKLEKDGHFFPKSAVREVTSLLKRQSLIGCSVLI